MSKKLFGVVRKQEGASAVEYGLILGLIAVAIVAVLLTMGPQLVTLFSNAETQIEAANTAPAGN